MSRFSENSILDDRRGIPGLPGHVILLGNKFLKENKSIPNLYTITNATLLTKDEMYKLKLSLPNARKNNIVEFYRESDGTRYAIEFGYDIDSENKISRKYTNPHSKLYSAFSGKFVDSAKQHKSDELGHFKYLNVELSTIRFIQGIGLVLAEKAYTKIDGVSDPGVFEDNGAMGVVVNVDKLIHALRNKGMISEVKRKREEEHAPVPAFYEDELDSLIHKGDSAERIYSEEIKLALELQAKFKAFQDFKSVLDGNGKTGDKRHIIQIVSTYFQHKTILDAELNSMLVPKIKEMQDILEGRQPQQPIDTLLKEVDSIFLPSFERLLREIKDLSMYHPKLKKNFNVDINDLTAPEHALNMLHQHSTSAKFDTTEKLAELRRKQLAVLDADDDDFDGGSRLKQKKKTRKRTKKRNKKRNKSKRHKGYSRR